MPVLLEKVPKVRLVRRSVLDQTKNKQPDFITVPAGTEIRVDTVEGKVVVPVRVGFATPIPALSNAAVRMNRVYYTPVFYNVVSGTTGNLPVAYGETAELTAVTVRGVTYHVQANASESAKRWQEAGWEVRKYDSNEKAQQAMVEWKTNSPEPAPFLVRRQA